jgi:hypothetical protein
MTEQMTPARMCSVATSAGPAVSVPDSPVATLPMQSPRELMETGASKPGEGAT